MQGTYQNGHIIPDRPVDWPEGCRVHMEPVAAAEATLGIRDEDWPNTPEGIARHLALMDKIEPLLMTPEEEAEWHAALEAQRQFEKANFEKHTREIDKLFE